jgi:hypothetical protein
MEEGPEEWMVDELKSMILIIPSFIPSFGGGI